MLAYLLKKLKPTIPSRADYLIILFLLSTLTGCAPKGAKNWPFSIGPQTYAVALGDLDGDEDLDAFLANGENEVAVPNTVWLNDGTGQFSDSGQQIGNHETRAVVLADLDGDGDLDALVANTGGLAFHTNNGQGTFDLKGRFLPQIRQGGAYVLSPVVADLNQDGFLDVLGGGCCGSVSTWDDNRRLVHPPLDRLWLNDGKAEFIESNQQFDTFGTSAVAAGDLDNDGDLDAFFANSSSIVDQAERTQRNQPDTIWINDGHGRFAVSSQMLGKAEASAVALGDLDGDGDLDAVVGNLRQDDEIWLNQGAKVGVGPCSFILSSVLDSDGDTRVVILEDLNQDGDLDALIVGKSRAQVWLNDGSSDFEAGSRLAFEPQHGLALGDLDGDGDNDVFAGSVNHGNRIWLIDGSGKLIIK